jgi:hypothetical protein
LLAIVPVNLDRQRGRDAMALQQRHQRFDALLLAPRPYDVVFLAAKAGHFAQTLRLLLDHAQRIDAKLVDDALG